MKIDEFRRINNLEGVSLRQSEEAKRKNISEISKR